MRIANSSMIRNNMYDNQENLQRTDKLNRQISTGKVINKVSDDPYKAIRIMNLKNEIKYTEKYNYNIDEAVGWMNNTDSSLEEVGTVLGDIKDEIIKLGNGTYSAEEMKSIRAEMNEKIKELGETLNTSHGGNHMFGGSDVEDLPIIIEEKDGVAKLTLNSKSNSQDLKAIISEGIDIDYNVSAKELLNKDGKNLLESINKLSTAMNDIVNGKDVETNKAQVLGTIKDDIDTLFNHSVDIRTSFGVKVNTAEKIKELNDENIMNMKDVLSLTQDTDKVSAYIELKSAELIYQMSVQVGSRLIQPSIMDYLK
ncbi:flagellin N-terminal helical domain-containing protein [Romboutsia sp. 1001216sp1]|uniref:flagellin N-terminal helical domain-containing protein n=1 Tax=Romboutsia sp. 1001216sp1 TaxID=2986997 RepID=UPI00232B9686|nr:hypothetical protein [Romboutsia sp. 1001216sp1]MDB8803922.1 hypothetical protein [Romboutsia sp. 1001216sp1]MDB8806728.1 hypothetical protein [Romboutsia sp. 1001216sp1]MDB8809569.1 hypothetical protein [Romboutsia sp. 1001216sp1]MDB8815318.1 hypothetical protein [Romboutsia sp. 1001216sp1]MDB8818011.1 hypothetical protein [Romboutsia sp. 1001216sp1]